MVVVETFERRASLVRETQRLARADAIDQGAAQTRLRKVTTELDNLYQNLLSGIASPTLRTMIAEREAEKVRLEARSPAVASVRQTATILPHPVLVEQFRDKVQALRMSLDDATTRTEAEEVLLRLIESVTIYPDEAAAPRRRWSRRCGSARLGHKRQNPP